MIREWINKHIDWIVMIMIIIFSFLIGYYVGLSLYDCWANGKCPEATNITANIYHVIVCH